jgi:hypothetical protein
MAINFKSKQNVTARAFGVPGTITSQSSLSISSGIFAFREYQTMNI